MRFAKHEWWLPKIFCLIAACALWVYVMNEQNPMVENTYTVPVEVRNLDRSLVATNVPHKVKAKIRMPRSDMVYMRSDNIKAYVTFLVLPMAISRIRRSISPYRGMNPSSRSRRSILTSILTPMP